MRSNPKAPKSLWTRVIHCALPKAISARFVATTLILTLLESASVAADDWPHFFGPYGDHTYREQGIVKILPEKGLPLRWKQSIQGGYSGPAVVGPHVYVMDRLAQPFDPGEVSGNPNFVRASIPGKERIRAYDSSSGELVWEHSYDCPYSTVYLYAIGPRCTPTVANGRVYTLGAEGNLLCLDAATGTLVWQRDFKSDYGLKIPEWGCAAHPLVAHGNLYCIVGGKESTLVCFDSATGAEKWRALSAEKPGYCPPSLRMIQGTEQLLVWHGEKLASLEPLKGSVFWSTDAKPLYGMAIGAPVVFENMIHVMGFNRFSMAFEVAENNQAVQTLWRGDTRTGAAGVLNTAYVDHEGFLYSAGGSREFHCVDIRTGKRHWSTSRPLQDSHQARHGAWPSAFTFHHPPSGITFIYNDHGELMTTQLSSEGYRETSRQKLIDPTHEVGGRLLVWSTPAFAQQKIYLRNDKELRCYDLSEPAASR